MNLKKNHYSRRALALLLTLVMCVGMIPTAFAAQQNSYHDPAEHWMQASGRTNELDANSVVTRETFKCGECGKATSFEVFRVPEYTRNGQPALSRNVKYSDGTMVDGVGKGDTMDGIPGKDATYTGYHYTKAVCETCGGINTNMSKSEYGYLKNVYWLYDCAAAFTQELDETVSYEYTDDTYHTVTTKGGTYCAFCYGTNHTDSRKLERHSMVTEVLPQPANGRFATVEKCSLCDYTRYDYTAAKAVVASYYGVVDGQPHTISVTDLSEAGVRTSIRYGNSADSCTMTSAPNYTDEGQYTVYYEITYTCDGVDMTENGVAYVWLRDDTTDENGNCGCGCSNPNCGCQNKNCNGNCCADKGCGENHKYILLDSTKAGCTSLGYDRYLCTECGKIEKRDYVDSLGHAWQSIVIRDATCETDGKLLELCSRCGQMKQTATPKGEHSYEVYTVAATCTSPGYTVRECSACGDRHIEDITAALPHNYESHVIAATCENGGKTIHRCDGCGSSCVTDYTDALGHSWDKGPLVTNATCTGEGVMEYRCTRCGYHRLDADPADGHIPGAPATCTEPQLCTRCGAVLNALLGDGALTALQGADWEEWRVFVETLSVWLDEPKAATVTLSGSDYTLPDARPDGVTATGGFAAPADRASGYTAALLAAEGSRTADALTGPLNGVYSAVTPERDHMADSAENAVFRRAKLTDLLADCGSEGCSGLVLIPFKCNFEDSDLTTVEYYLDGLLDYPVLADVCCRALNADTDAAGLKAAKSAALWLYSNGAGEDALTETLGVVTPWNTAADSTAVLAMQIEQVGTGILPGAVLDTATAEALTANELSLQGSEKHTKAERTAFVDDALAALGAE